MFFNVTEMRQVRVKDLQRGEVFLPLAAADGIFLAGKLNEYDLRIVLNDAEKPFHIAEVGQWSRGVGVALSDIYFEADPASGLKVDGFTDMEAGLLIMAGDATGIVGSERETRFPIWVAGEHDTSNADSVGFRNWRLVHGVGDRRQVIFERSAQSKG